jgi:hypothetical protein
VGKNDPRFSFRDLDTEEQPPSPETARQLQLEAENRELKVELKHLRSTVRTVAAIMRPYSPPVRAIKK